MADCNYSPQEIRKLFRKFGKLFRKFRKLFRKLVI